MAAGPTVAGNSTIDAAAFLRTISPPRRVGLAEVAPTRFEVIDEAR
jgi:hypothetical protein